MEIRRTEILYGKEIKAELTMAGETVHVLLSGGDTPHIGAVSMAAPSGERHTMEFSGHKEAVVSEAWADEICRKTGRETVVAAGIHYDAASPEMIQEILAVTGQMRKRLLCHLLQNHTK